MNRRISSIYDPKDWDGAARPMTEEEAWEILGDIAEDISAAGFSFAIIVEPQNEDELDDRLFPTIH